MDWSLMKVGLVSRHCSKCDSPVIDFTKYDREGILQFLILNFENPICARIYPSQLDITYSELYVVINRLAKRERRANLLFYYLTVGTLVLSGCTNHEDQNLPTTNQIESNSGYKLVAVNLSEVEVPEFKPPPIMGGIALYKPGCMPVKIADEMPEFIGGIDSLTVFIENNLHGLEEFNIKEEQIDIVVRFTVLQDGSILNPLVLNPIDSLADLGKEAMRVVSIMPKWKPGRIDGKEVEVDFNLPIIFKMQK